MNGFVHFLTFRDASSLAFGMFAILIFPISAFAAAPYGGLDSVSSCDSIVGWAQDPDVPSQPISVAMYIDASTGAAAFAGTTLANQDLGRTDLASIGAQRSSYTFSVPAQYRDGNPHTIYAYGLDSTYGPGNNGDGSFILLVGSPKTFTCSPPPPVAPANTLPRGGLDSITSTCDAVGWTQDPDVPSQPISAHFYVDAPSGASAYVGNVLANQNQGRTDLVSIGADKSSYTFSIPAQYRDGKSHTIYVYAIDTSDGNQHSLLTGSPKTFTCSPPLPTALPVAANDGHLKIEATGNIQTVHKATDSCNADDLADTALHAFRSADGTVNLTGSHWQGNYRSTGSTLDLVKRDCSPTYTSANDTVFGNFKYHEWLFSPYTLDGTTVYALTHNEWYPSLANPPFCPVNTGPAPVVGAITLLVSTNGGATYSHPMNYKVSGPLAPWESTFSCNAAYGDWNVSNIIKKDSYYYALFNRIADPKGVANSGTCAMRTSQLGDAYAWQVWTGSNWDLMSTTAKCAPLTGLDSWKWTVVESLVYSTYLNKYVALAIDNSTHVMYSVSSDLLNWSTPQQIIGLPVSQGALWYGSLLDPTDTSRNFENIGREPYLYFTLNGDIIRQKIRFTQLGVSTSASIVPPPPAATAPTPSQPTSENPVIVALQNKIQALLVQIAALQGQAVAPATPLVGGAPSAASCPNITRNLSRGSRGTDVMSLQQFLISQNLLAVDSATGFFGGLSEAAVKQWQTRNGVVSSGSPATTGYGAVGPKTRAALSRCN